MSGPFIALTESETNRLMLVNLDRVTCVAPHGRGGSFVYLVGTADRMEVDETPPQIAEMLKRAGVAAPTEAGEA